MADKLDENCCDQVTLTLDDGTDLLCDILAIFPCGDKEYIALVPSDGDENSDIYLYGFKQGETEDEEKRLNEALRCRFAHACGSYRDRGH